MSADAAAPAAPAAKRLTLRLDNGTIISSSGTDAADAVVLTTEQAWNAGLLKENHLLHIQALVSELSSKLPEEAPPKSVSTGSKRSADTALPEVAHTYAPAQPAKKPRTSDGGYANGGAAPAPVAAPAPAAARPAAAAGGADWVETCRRIVHFLQHKVLGAKDSIFFMNPVDPVIVPDYPLFIKNPICFNDILARLNAGAYAGPVDFYNDVFLLCDNCYTFNVEKRPSAVGNLGLKIEAAFGRAWANTLWARDVPPRGPVRAPPVFAPVQPAKRVRGGPSAPGGARAPRPHPAGVPPRGRGRGRGRPPGSFTARTKSVNSYLSVQPLSRDKIDALATALGDNAVLEAKMDGVVSILRAANELLANEEGEVELDLSVLSPHVVWQLYELCIGPPGVAAAAGVGAVAPHAQPPALPFGGEDSDYNPDEEDDE